MVVDEEEVLVLIPHEFIQLYAVFETNIQILKLSKTIRASIEKPFNVHTKS